MKPLYFLPTSTFTGVPARQRVNWTAVYNLHCAEAAPNPRWESFRTQASLARFFGCSVRTIQRHERDLVRWGKVRVEHVPKTNRRTVTILNQLPSTLSYQQRRQTCRHVDDKIVAKSGAEASSLLLKKNSSEEARSARAGDQRGSSIPRETRPPLPELAQRKLAPALRHWMRVSAIDDNGKQYVTELAEDLVRYLGVQKTVERLGHIEAKNATIKDAQRRAAMSVGFLRRMVEKAEERRGPRTGKALLARAGL